MGTQNQQIFKNIGMKRIETIKKGSIIHYKDKPYIVNGYCKTNKAYEITSYWDNSKWKYLKKGTEVEVDREF